MADGARSPVLAVVGGGGGTGTTTVAAAVADAWAGRSPGGVLYDAAGARGTVAALVDVGPGASAQDLASVGAGLDEPALAAVEAAFGSVAVVRAAVDGLDASSAARLVDALAAAHPWVVADCGTGETGEAAAVVAAAGLVVVCAAASVLGAAGVRRVMAGIDAARAARGPASVDEPAIAVLVVGRHERGTAVSPARLAAATGLRLIATVPADASHIGGRADAGWRPGAVARGRDRTSAALRDLAGAVWSAPEWRRPEAVGVPAAPLRAAQGDPYGDPDPARPAAAGADVTGRPPGAEPPRPIRLLR